ncbi:MAG: 3-hydroxyacyl-[acyl-carrier-protein] dehydratase FabA [Spirochaetes bacterium GWB1_48_6]|nr:MAG: 3-hydroxyacyl-[acyl-carrier-protein] dehydratase FabA [Spirochaetes bacterium GWB1_48_6]
MKYADYLKKTSLDKTELLALAWGSLVEDPPEGGFANLPAPPMLMLDRVTSIEHNGSRGRIVAEQDVLLDAWFFQCHFRTDPVQPGCLGVDAVWQLMGLYTGIRGAKGAGRALGVGEIEFLGQIRPHNKVVRYEIDIRRYTDLPSAGSSICVGSAKVFVDDELIYILKDAKVGIFLDIRYEDYPHLSEKARGGQMKR